MKFRGGMAELMRQASRMQRKIAQRKEELKEELFEAQAGSDAVSATANGAGDIVSLNFEVSLFEQEGEEIAKDLIIAACNAAIAKSKEHVEAEIETLTGGLKIPGLT